MILYNSCIKNLKGVKMSSITQISDLPSKVVVELLSHMSHKQIGAVARVNTYFLQCTITANEINKIFANNASIHFNQFINKLNAPYDLRCEGEYLGFRGSLETIKLLKNESEKLKCLYIVTGEIEYEKPVPDWDWNKSDTSDSEPTEPTDTIPSNEYLRPVFDNNSENNPADEDSICMYSLQNPYITQKLNVHYIPKGYEEIATINCSKKNGFEVTELVNLNFSKSEIIRSLIYEKNDELESPWVSLPEDNNAGMIKEINATIKKTNNTTFITKFFKKFF